MWDTMTSELSCIIFNPDSPAQAAVIWLHGLGADGRDFEPIVPDLQSRLTLPIRFIFPNAPFRSITINGGYEMRAWYDITALDLSQAEDAEGIYESTHQLNTLIRRELDNNIPARRIVLAGFSQGGAIALHTGLRYPQRLAGILALSTYLPLAATVSSERHQANHDIPIFMGHGVEDTVVPLYYAQSSNNLLLKLGYRVEFHSYNMPHSLCTEEVDDIADWISNRLKS
jgi:phospholipase/carboxylesterase